ncbi:MAG: deoxyribodipyrimidine photolyase [Bacteroidetes bacterium QS_9_68_14]|nr:MAG: deoxyribodipyrimidine photolyase [Bacteroidetes bacterium QS_9_68_14]
MPSPERAARERGAAVQIVWLKRDLRVADHPPLAEAARRGPVLPLYVVEPRVLESPDASARHWAFVRQSLVELREALAALGQPLVVRVGAVTPVLEGFRKRFAARGVRLWAHQETGDARTYARDEAVRRWARRRGVAFVEKRQHGVVRAMKSRDGWADQWERFMERDLAATPGALQPVEGVAPGPIPTVADLRERGWLVRGPDATGDEQDGGSNAGQRVADSFFEERGQRYRGNMSSPLTAFDTCSRLSAHLAFGTVSLRQLVQRTWAEQDRRAEQARGRRTAWTRSLASFESRLHWHGHFIQKLERAPRLQFESYAPALDELRAGTLGTDEGRAHLAAWAAGRTGFPLVDACQRALRQTGYLNFRMRAMLTSFAAYDLWLPWQRFGPTLARRWTDYEPGIHFPQLQMQSGTTGSRTLRIYNPTKQAQDHDPEGAFIRRWVPELRGVPAAFIHHPWLMPKAAQDEAGCQIGGDYPEPLVNHDQAARQAKARFSEAFDRADVQRQAEAALARHGSRRGRRRHRKRQKQRDAEPRETDEQLSLAL